MPSISNNPPLELLETVPDFIDWNLALQWIQEGQKKIETFPKNKISKKEITFLEWSQISEKEKSLLGLYPQINWRKFVLATFFADLVSYTQPIDRVNFERLLFVMHAFPQGFRIWWLKLDSWIPIGYSGWYPMLETAFELFERHSEKIKDRMVVPNLKVKNPYVYLFNFSVAPQYKKSILSKSLIKKFAADVNAQNALGMACLTVSEEGKKVAEHFGMSYSGDMNFDNSHDKVFVKRCKT